jgi:hypothetical protein
MGAPQIMVIILMATSMGAALGNHGKPRRDKYSFWVTTANQLITAAILYWGGFWN